MIGKRFGKLIVLEEMEERLHKAIAFKCKCDCGNETLATRYQLKSGRKKSCGCLRKKTPDNALDLTGKKFGRLIVIERDGRTKNESALWLCKCDCGKTVKANATSLRRGETTSCGCSRKYNIKKARQTLTEKTIDGVQVPLLQKKVRRDSRTGHKGITIRKRYGKTYYEVSIGFKAKRKYIGTFKELEDAIKARKQAEEKYHDPYIKALEEKENRSDNIERDR